MQLLDPGQLTAGGDHPLAGILGSFLKQGVDIGQA